MDYIKSAFVIATAAAAAIHEWALLMTVFSRLASLLSPYFLNFSSSSRKSPINDESNDIFHLFHRSKLK